MATFSVVVSGSLPDISETCFDLQEDLLLSCWINPCPPSAQYDGVLSRGPEGTGRIPRSSGPGGPRDPGACVWDQPMRMASASAIQPEGVIGGHAQGVCSRTAEWGCQHLSVKHRL